MPLTGLPVAEMVVASRSAPVPEIVPGPVAAVADRDGASWEIAMKMAAVEMAMVKAVTVIDGEVRGREKHGPKIHARSRRGIRRRREPRHRHWRARYRAGTIEPTASICLENIDQLASKHCRGWYYPPLRQRIRPLSRDQLIGIVKRQKTGIAAEASPAARRRPRRRGARRRLKSGGRRRRTWRPSACRACGCEIRS